VSFARVSWLIIVAVCAVGAVLLVVGGYTGYAITACAVGLAAAVNLLPPPGRRAEELEDTPEKAALGHRAPPGAGPPPRHDPAPPPEPTGEAPHQPAR
jgi:hypothetical protein